MEEKQGVQLPICEPLKEKSFPGTKRKKLVLTASNKIMLKQDISALLLLFDKSCAKSNETGTNEKTR